MATDEERHGDFENQDSELLLALVCTSADQSIYPFPHDKAATLLVHAIGRGRSIQSKVG